MLLQALGAVVAVALLVALPGWLLVQAIFPRRDALGAAERVYLALAGGVLVAMLVGIVLGFLPHGGRGMLQSLPLRGMPNVEIAMIGVCLGLFWIGAARGAYPAIASRYPRLVAPWAKASEASEQGP